MNEQRRDAREQAMLEAANHIACSVYPMGPDGGYDYDHVAIAPITAALLAAPPGSLAHILIKDRAESLLRKNKDWAKPKREPAPRPPGSPGTSQIKGLG